MYAVSVRHDGSTVMSYGEVCCDHRIVAALIEADPSNNDIRGWRDRTALDMLDDYKSKAGYAKCFKLLGGVKVEEKAEDTAPRMRSLDERCPASCNGTGGCPRSEICATKNSYNNPYNNPYDP